MTSVLCFGATFELENRALSTHEYHCLHLSDPLFIHATHTHTLTENKRGSYVREKERDREISSMKEAYLDMYTTVNVH